MRRSHYSEHQEQASLRLLSHHIKSFNVANGSTGVDKCDFDFSKGVPGLVGGEQSQKHSLVGDPYFSLIVRFLFKF